jgi:hypothetical protein
MPADVKPLFRPDALRPKLAEFNVTPAAVAARPKLAEWVKLLASDAGKKRKETELLADFLRDVFVELLGYTPPPSEAYTLKREALVQVDGKFADAALGRFGGAADEFVVMVEGKGPKDPLDIPFAGRKLSAVDQALKYAVNSHTDWYLVTNLRELRLYSKQADQRTYERFELAKLAADDAEFARFVFLLGADRLLDPAGTHLNAVLADSAKLGRELTRQFYDEYRALRIHTFDALKKHNPGQDPAKLLAATQKILDRVLFVAFAEDRKLLPGDIIARAYQHSDPFNPRPVWDNFKSLFRAVDKGSKPLGIWQYNGGLFAEDEFIDSLAVPDTVCAGFKLLSDYEYGSSADTDAPLVDVDILGHVFEQSISDLEEMQNAIAGKVVASKAKEQKRNSRKEAGAFYTPAFITRHIVRETLRPVLDAKFETLRQNHEANVPKKGEGANARTALKDPATFKADKLQSTQTAALVKFWEAWVAELETVRVVDPACGSGAFLIEAFDQLFAEYERAQGYLTQLRGPTLFDIRKAILEHNLYGVDLNGEAVEIARLSCWIKTAEEGKTLASLDHNIVRGNSVVTDPAFHPEAFGWRQRFPEVFACGGFDVVIGNPPYVRQEWIKEYKPHWAVAFQSHTSTADLFVYFYELGVKLLRPGGRLGFITSGGWVRGAYGEGLREYLATNAGLESMIDFGEFQPFEDAEMIRPTILVASKREPGGPMKLWKWLQAGRPPEDLSERIASAAPMRTDHLGRDAWELESDEVIALRCKLTANGRRLAEASGATINRGILSGLTEVFVVDEQRRVQLIRDDPNSAALLMPFIQGTHVRPWYVEESGEYILAIKSSGDHTWPWSSAGGEAESVFARTYPAVHAYLSQHRTAAVARSDQGRFWWELRSCGYWDFFGRPKIVWPDIGNYPRFSIDTTGRCFGNTVYGVACADPYVQAVLSSWASWFYISKTAQPLRLRSNRWQYRLFTQYMENIPIPAAPATEREALGKLAERCNQLGTSRYQIEEQVRGRLTTGFRTDPATKLNERAQEWWQLPLTDLGDALKTSFKLKRNPLSNPATADEWEPYLTGKRSEVDALRCQLTDAEREINDRVFRLFHLTPDEIKLLLKEVEH